MARQICFEVVPEPTSPTIVDVVTDEDWTMNVSTMPKTIATAGLPNT